MKLAALPARVRAASRNLLRQRVRLTERQYRAESLGIDRAAISREALQTVKTLQQAGHDAWLVGGCVRDLLLGQKPKDFDIATRARPQQITPLFRRSRIIGRRFQIVHVPFRGPDRRRFLEVSTLRKWPRLIDREGLALDDNCWSDQLEDDALRRDFTVNALYLDCVSGIVSDFTNGIEDINNRLLKVIGDPAERFREDPVRMLRLARFHAKYQFSVADSEHRALQDCAPLLLRTDTSRRLLEAEKLLLSGCATATFRVLGEMNLLEYLLAPSVLQLPQAGRDFANRLRKHALQSTDRAVANGGHFVGWGWLLSALLWPAFVAARANRSPKGPPPHQLAQQILRAQIAYTSVYRRDQEQMLAVWRTQTALERDHVAAGTLASNHFLQALWLARVRQRADDPAMAEFDSEAWKERHLEVRPHSGNDGRAASQDRRRQQRRRPRRRPHHNAGRSRKPDRA